MERRVLAQLQHPQPHPGAAGQRGYPVGLLLRPANLLSLPGSLHDWAVPLQTGPAAHVHQTSHAIWPPGKRQDHAGVLQREGFL